MYISKLLSMKKIIILSSVVISCLSSFAQSNQVIWKSINEKDVSITGKRDIVPEKCHLSC